MKQYNESIFKKVMKQSKKLFVRLFLSFSKKFLPKNLFSLILFFRSKKNFKEKYQKKNLIKNFLKI